MKLSVRHQLYKSDFIERINFKFNEITEPEKFMIQVIGIICLVICILLDTYLIVKTEKNKKNVAMYLAMIGCDIVGIICLVFQIK